MKLKHQHMLAAVAATVFTVLAGNASAADNACANIAEQRTQIEKALFEHFGGSDRQVELGRNDGNYAVLRLRSQVGTIVGMNGCSLRYSVLTQKYSAAVENTGNNPPKAERSKNGRIVWHIDFDPSHGAKLCIRDQHMTDVNWKDEGAVKEKIFRNANGDKKYFSGCLLG